MTTYLVLSILLIMSMFAAEFVCRTLFHKESLFKRVMRSLLDASKTLIVVIVFSFVVFSVFYLSQYLTLKIMAGI